MDSRCSFTRPHAHASGASMVRRVLLGSRARCQCQKRSSELGTWLGIWAGNVRRSSIPCKLHSAWSAGMLLTAKTLEPVLMRTDGPCQLGNTCDIYSPFSIPHTLCVYEMASCEDIKWGNQPPFYKWAMGPVRENHRLRMCQTWSGHLIKNQCVDDMNLWNGPVMICVGQTWPGIGRVNLYKTTMFWSPNPDIWRTPIYKIRTPPTSNRQLIIL